MKEIKLKATVHPVDGGFQGYFPRYGVSYQGATLEEVLEGLRRGFIDLGLLAPHEEELLVLEAEPA